MIQNYFKIAWRNLWKDRTFTFLNVVGLSAAFGVAFLLCMYALFELSYDKFHENSDSIYQVYTNVETPKGTESSLSNPVPFAAAFQEEVPGVQRITRYLSGGPSVIIGDNTHRVSAIWTDPDFLKMFSFPVLLGDQETMLSDRSSVVISQETAKRFFGDENPIGKTMELPDNGANKPVVITAVLKTYPAASTFKPEVIFNFTNLPERWYASNLDSWDNHNHEIYVQLEEGLTSEKLEASTENFSQLHFTSNIANAKRDGAQVNAAGTYRQIKLLPLTDLNATTISNKLVTVSRNLQYLILGVAFLILFIASVNFINMSIAKGSQRLREIGMRKTLGAGKGQLFLQFWGESILVFSVSILLGAALSYGLLKPFQELFRTDATFFDISSATLILALLGSLLLVTFIAGGYPAYLMSKLGTLQALKGKLATQGQNRVRNVLMVLQFSIAILLISGTLVLWQQLEFMRSKDLGFNKEQVLSFPISSEKTDDQVLQLLRNELESNPSIVSVTASNNSLGRGRDNSTSTSTTGFEHQGREIKTNILMVDYDYPETLDMEIVTGRTFDRARPGDSLSVVINETMAKQFTEENPLDIVMNLGENYRFNVIGVIKDYNFQDLTKTIEPLSLFKNDSRDMRYAYVKVRPENLTQSYTIVKNAWNKIEPDREFLGSYLDENIENTLRKERLMITMISSGSLLAILLSCIGLFAMSLLVVAQRRKEIGVRKVVGASVRSITALLTVDFLKLVIVAILIATPIAWWGATQWLQDYNYRINLSIWVFALAGAIALFIALVTIGIQTIKAAMANPVHSLKTE